MQLPGQTSIFNDNAEYDAFVEKFQPKRTTDDCYTPANIYDAIADWAAREYSLDRAAFLRPFYPGGDYLREEYPEGCVVVDNPPFSILSQIRQFYQRRGIRYFLFAPALTALSGVASDRDCLIACYCDIVYENGANVKTSFVTNLEPELAMRTAPDLTATVNRLSKENQKKGKAELPKYEYPDHVITAAKAGWFSQHGVEWKLRRKDCRYIREMDAQKAVGKGIFGNGYLLSERAAAERAAAERAAAERAAAERAAAERAAAERAAAERAAAHKWALSQREWDIVRSMSVRDSGLDEAQD